MRQVIIPTFITAFLSCILCGIIIGIADSWAMGFYASVMLFGSFLIPTLIATITFLLLKNKTTLSTTRATMWFQSLLLSIIFITGLFLWALFSVAYDSAGTDNIFIAFVTEFKTQFMEFLPVAILQAIIIPIIHNLLNARQTNEPNVSHNP